MIRVTSVNSRSDVWLIYESAFPRSERRSRVQHELAMRSDPTFHCKQLMLGEKVVGLLFYWELPSCLFVEHLAVAEQCRGLGVGTAALKWLQEQGKLLILEIEPPQDAPSRRRLAFYQAAGFVLLPYEHVQLPFHADTPSVPMRLLSWPCAAAASDVECLENCLRHTIMRYTDSVTN